MGEGISEHLPTGPQEDVQNAENQGKINEKVAEFHARASGSDPVVRHMKKQEKKARKHDHTLADFLIYCIHSHILSEDLIAALNQALHDNHSQHLLVTSLRLIYDIHTGDTGKNFSLVLYSEKSIIPLSQWLLDIEQSAYEEPQKTLAKIMSHPQSLRLFLEKVLQEYIHHYQPNSETLDLMSMSQSLIESLQNLLHAYIAQHSLS